MHTCALYTHTYTAAAAAKSLQSCPTLCDPIDGSPPGSPVPGILQARTLEWVAMPSSRRNYIVTAKLNARKKRRKKRRNGMREEGKAN